MIELKVLVTGGTGYIGRILVPELVKEGYDVTVIDRGFLDYDNPEKDPDFYSVNIIRDDIRTVDPDILRDQEAVIDLAALSNDPSGALNPFMTWDINYLGRVRIARLAKKHGTKIYVVASSCSVYGFREEISDEKTPPNPLTTYAMANVEVEKDNLSLNDKNFRSTALRFATVFGYSKRFRLDLVINAMTFYGCRDNIIKMMRDGSQYRPFVHVKDVSRAVISTIESDNEEIGGRAINIGNNNLNMQIKDIAEIIKRKLDNKPEIVLYGDPDKRSYRVNFDLAKKLLKFETKYTIEDGIEEIIKECKNNPNDLLQMHTVDTYKRLLEYEKEIKKYILKNKIIF